MTIPTESETTATPALDGAALTIESIEVTPIVVPLEQEYRGSYYGMRNRSTVLTRVTTRQGVVGEAYAGDEDATLRDIAAVVTNELAPRSSAAGSSGFRSRSTSSATAGSASSPSRASTWRSGTRSARSSTVRSGSSGAGTGTRSASTSSAATTAATSPGSGTR